MGRLRGCPKEPHIRALESNKLEREGIGKPARSNTWWAKQNRDRQRAQSMSACLAQLLPLACFPKPSPSSPLPSRALICGPFALLSCFILVGNPESPVAYSTCKSEEQTLQPYMRRRSRKVIHRIHRNGFASTEIAPLPAVKAMVELYHTARPNLSQPKLLYAWTKPLLALALRRR